MSDWVDTELRVRESGVYGQLPAVWMNTAAIDGDALPFARAPVGSLYGLLDKDNRLLQWYVKRSAGQVDNDWGPLGGMGVIAQRVTYDQFTDGGGAVGTLDLAQTIPAGAVAQRSNVFNVTGFAGDVSAAMTIGDGTDADRYNTSTVNVFADAAALDCGAVSGTAWHSAAKTPKLTITTATDWGLVTAGALTVVIFYLGA